jgi:hypothetical protein
MKIAPAFQEALRDFDLDHLEAHPGTVYAVSPDTSLQFLNSAWDRFYAENGGREDQAWGLGARLLDATPEALRPFYETRFQQTIAENRPWEHVYECSSPEAVRQFHMLAYPLPAGAGALVINSLQYQAPRPSEGQRATDAYLDEYGLVHQCAHCRKVRRIADRRVWDWAPALVRSPYPRTSHALCPPCFGYYYNEASLLNRRHPEVVQTMEPLSEFALALVKEMQSAAPGAAAPPPALDSPEQAFYSAKGARRVD